MTSRGTIHIRYNEEVMKRLIQLVTYNWGTNCKRLMLKYNMSYDNSQSMAFSDAAVLTIRIST